MTKIINTYMSYSCKTLLWNRFNSIWKEKKLTVVQLKIFIFIKEEICTIGIWMS